MRGSGATAMGQDGKGSQKLSRREKMWPELGSVCRGGEEGEEHPGDLMANWNVGRQGSCREREVCPSPSTSPFSPSPITPLTKQDMVKV